MSAYIYPIILVSLQDFCNHQLVARLDSYRGEQSAIYNAIFLFANMANKFVGVAFLISLLIVKTSLPWYSPIIVGSAGFVGGLLLYFIVNFITIRFWIVDFLLKIVSVLGVVALAAAEIMWLLSFVEVVKL